MSLEADRKNGRKSVVVVGAGFSGLVSAYYLAKAGYAVELFEAKPGPGGLIGTLEGAHGRVETAANALLNSALVEDLFSDLELPLLSTKKEARKRYIVRNGEARRWPLGFFGTLRLVRFALKYFFMRASLRPAVTESASHWATRVLGSEGAQYLVEAALQGIYAGDPSKMSASLLFGRFFETSTKPVRRARVRGSVSAPEGMGQLIRALETKLEKLGCVFHYGTSSEVEPSPTRPTVVATSASEAARVLHKHSPQIANALEKVELVPVTSATLFFHRTDPSTRGFGCLFPPVEKRGALGVLKNDFIFEGRVKGDIHSETWILGGAMPPAGFDRWTQKDIVDVIVGERTKIFDLSDAPADVVITKWPHAIPHYTIELERTLPMIAGIENNVFLIGNYLGQIGLAKILERASRLPEEVAQRGKWN